MELCKGKSDFARVLFVMFVLYPVGSGTTQPTTNVASITASIAPRNITQQREGDTVSLLCEVVHFDVARHVLHWSYMNTTTNKIIIIATSNGSIALSVDRFLSSFKDIDTASSSYNLNLTIPSVTQTDARVYTCSLEQIKQGQTTFGRLLRVNLVFAVYSVNVFPTCVPNGPAAVNVGHRIMCITETTATPVVGDDSGWTEMEESDGQTVITKDVKNTDDGKTFVCTAEIQNAAVNLTCNIGPLTIVGPSTTGVTTVTVASPYHGGTGLSVAAISGIAIGAVLLSLIAVLALCCCCCSRKWKLARSAGPANQHTESTRRQSDVEMTSSNPRQTGETVQPDNPKIAENTAVSQQGEDKDSQRSTVEAEPNFETEATTPQPRSDTKVLPFVNVDVSPADARPSPLNPAATSPSKYRPQIANKPVMETSNRRPQRQTSNQDVGDETGAYDKEDTPAVLIYAQVNKSVTTPSLEDEPTDPGRSDKRPIAVIKPIVTTNGAEKEDNGSIEYADLNLAESRSFPATPTDVFPTLYAEIKQ